MVLVVNYALIFYFGGKKCQKSLYFINIFILVVKCGNNISIFELLK